MRNSSAKLKSAVYCVKLHGNVRIEDDVVARDEDEYSSCVIDCLDYGDQTTARESPEIGEYRGILEFLFISYSPKTKRNFLIKLKQGNP